MEVLISIETGDGDRRIFSLVEEDRLLKFFSRIDSSGTGYIIILEWIQII
ncbi:hypothetical protein LEP1GSC036_0269 [Leptospira weilii str. 2006001853]|uniref:EF-hand domain-containing protein n=1 Tax=Leptospira weilii str. 2006001853 TaxID=1001589 RepID=A0A828Z4L4_9LEPT|nr:hypothetical protein LEP1GSC036_0269 [Leptospira weilii str. 2006001853]EMN44137.1 hypothetical protein LEP1GSC086_0882 [Leptospira weilii str. LNT 1234]